MQINNPSPLAPLPRSRSLVPVDAPGKDLVPSGDRLERSSIVPADASSRLTYTGKISRPEAPEPPPSGVNWGKVAGTALRVGLAVAGGLAGLAAGSAAIGIGSAVAAPLAIGGSVYLAVTKGNDGMGRKLLKAATAGAVAATCGGLLGALAGAYGTYKMYDLGLSAAGRVWRGTSPQG